MKLRRDDARDDDDDARDGDDDARDGDDDAGAAALRARLRAALRAGETRAPISPRLLAQGRWWPQDQPWPAALTAGVIEARRGYRFRPENVAVAGWLRREPPGGRVVDLGAGSGSLLLLALALCEPARAVGVERQAASAERLQRTLEAHGRGEARVICADLREADAQAQAREHLGGAADLVLANPPFFPAGWGRASAERSVHASTHALHGDVGDFLSAAAALLAPEGRALVVFDAQRLAWLLAAAGDAGLAVERLLWIADQRPGRPPDPFRVWVALRRDAGPLPAIARLA